MIQRIVLVAAWLALAASQSFAQTYPDRPIKLIVPFPAGGPMDVMARQVGQYLQSGLRQPVIVENRGGAGGALGSKAVAQAEPDGYTLLWGSSGTLSILPALNPNLDYVPKAFVPVSLVSLLPHVMVVPTTVPAKTVGEFVAYVKANPGKLNFAASLGTPPHLLGALFKHLAGVDITFIPYRGSASSITDLLGGQAHLLFDALTVLYPLIQEGKLRALAVTSPQRWPQLPDVPTMIESGYPNLPANAWSGVFAPPRTPPAIVNRLNEVINESVKTPEAQLNFSKLSAITRPVSPGGFAAFVAEQVLIWAALVKLSGAKIDN